MKNVIVFPLVLISFVAGGALGLSRPSGSIVEHFSGQTYRGLSSCIEKSLLTSLSEDESRGLCASRHSIDLTQEISLRGQGAPVERDLREFFFVGDITNTHAGYLVTFVQISLSVFDEEGAVAEYEVFGNVWAVPFEETEIEFRISPRPKTDILAVEWCDHETEDDDRQSCKSWEITSAAGVPL